MKKFASLVLTLALAATLSVFAVSAAEEVVSETEAYGYVNVTVKEGLCELVDNSETNHQAADNPLCFAEAYGTGRTSQGDAVKFSEVTFTKKVTSISVKCGYNLGAEKAGTSTQFGIYLDRIEGEPIAKVEVSDSETASSKIIDQVWKTVEVSVEPGTYDVYVVGESENSGSFSQVNFGYEGVSLEEALAKKAADEQAKAEAEKKAAEEAALKEALEAAKKAAEDAANKDAEGTAQNTEGEATTEAPAEAGIPVYVWVIIGVVVVAVIAAVIVISKKKK